MAKSSYLAVTLIASVRNVNGPLIGIEKVPNHKEFRKTVFYRLQG